MADYIEREIIWVPLELSYFICLGTINSVKSNRGFDLGV